MAHRKKPAPVRSSRCSRGSISAGLIQDSRWLCLIAKQKSGTNKRSAASRPATDGASPVARLNSAKNSSVADS